jgi:hypothetical protein
MAIRLDSTLDIFLLGWSLGAFTAETTALSAVSRAA